MRGRRDRGRKIGPCNRATRLSLALFLLVLGLLVAAIRPAFAQAASDWRTPLALLIAEGSYRAADKPLTLPARNARSFADELRHAGFEVELDEDLGRDAMQGAIRDFTEKITPGDSVLFFFSGYAIGAKGSTYLVPVDVDIWTEPDVVARGIDLAEIARGFDKAGAEVKLFVLDASRRNPYERRFRSLSAGVGPVVLPKGSLMIASADLGKVADDGDGETSLFVDELLKEMRAPDLAADEVFSRTRIGVSRATNGEQKPYVFSSLTRDFFFAGRKEPESFGAEAAPDGEALPQRPKTAPSAPPATGPLTGEPVAGMVFRDCDQCPDVVVVPAGEFERGSEAFETEKPVQRVVIAKPFGIGRAEVTFAQWNACVAGGGCSFRPESQGAADLPVSGVSWPDAQAYIAWLSRRTGERYRLPTEAEWEYAARGGTTTAFWWGDDARAGFANCRGCGGGGGQKILPVGSYQPNPFGLVDTAGNVAEWVEDCWTESYQLAARDASGAQTRACKQRVVRGGSFDAGPRYARSASRFPYDADMRYYPNGFRVARDLP